PSRDPCGHRQNNAIAGQFYHLVDHKPARLRTSPPVFFSEEPEMRGNRAVKEFRSHATTYLIERQSHPAQVYIRADHHDALRFLDFQTAAQRQCFTIGIPLRKPRLLKENAGRIYVNEEMTLVRWCLVTQSNQFIPSF